MAQVVPRILMLGFLIQIWANQKENNAISRSAGPAIAAEKLRPTYVPVMLQRMTISTIIAQCTFCSASTASDFLGSTASSESFVVPLPVNNSGRLPSASSTTSSGSSVDSLSNSSEEANSSIMNDEISTPSPTSNSRFKMMTSSSLLEGGGSSEGSAIIPVSASSSLTSSLNCGQI